MDVVNSGVSDCILRVQQVMAACGKSRSAIYKDLHEGRFPRQIKITGRAAGRSRIEIEAWLEERKRPRDEG